MPKHKYGVGVTVHFMPGPADGSAARGSYKIVRQLPSETSVHQYRVKSMTDGHERVVREDQLSR